MAVLFALISSLSWGTADFLGGLAAKLRPLLESDVAALKELKLRVEAMAAAKEGLVNALEAHWKVLSVGVLHLMADVVEVFTG